MEAEKRMVDDSVVNEVNRLAFIGAISLPSGKEKGKGRAR